MCLFTVQFLWCHDDIYGPFIESISSIKAVFRWKFLSTVKIGPKLAVLGEMGVNVKFWFYDPEKSHPCLEPHLLTYFVAKAVGWIKNQKIAESTLVPTGQGSETGESLLGNIYGQRVHLWQLDIFSWIFVMTQHFCITQSIVWFLYDNWTHCLILLLFWHAQLGVHSAMRRRQPPQRAVLGQVDCFIQCEVVDSQISLDSHVQPCDMKVYCDRRTKRCCQRPIVSCILMEIRKR